MHIDLAGVGPVALGVIATLLVMSILSTAILIERLWTYRRSSRQSKVCALEAAKLLRLGNLREAHELARRPALRDAHVGRIISAGLREWDQEDVMDGETRLE